jgi:hypothetical protein
VAELPGAGAPRAAAANATGGFTLLTSGRTPHRWSWPPGACGRARLSWSADHYGTLEHVNQLTARRIALVVMPARA